jgi:SAM-dependent methyltransferase
MNPSPTSPQKPADPVGAATLEMLGGAPAFNRWMFDRISPWIGSRILEIGSGIGNMSRFLVGQGSVVLTDPKTEYLEVLQRTFVERRTAQRRTSDVPATTERRSGGDRRMNNLGIVEMTLPDVPAELIGSQFDTIVCLNVLEHIEDDVGSLESMRTLLESGGRLVLLVPALPVLYGTIDAALGHFRRYTPSLLRSRFDRAGLTMLHLEYFNLAAVPGWWFAGRLLRRTMIPTTLLSLYDKFVPIFRLERFLPLRIGQSLIAIGERP